MIYKTRNNCTKERTKKVNTAGTRLSKGDKIDEIRKENSIKSL